MNSTQQNDFQPLRQKAEELLIVEERPIESDPADLQKIVHDLQVHQIELEIQNDALREAQNKLLASFQELEKANNLFHQLYHFSPIGYVMMNNQGLIRQANKAFSELIAKPLSEINGSYFSFFIADSDKVVFITRLGAFFKQPDDKQFELCLQSKTGKTAHVIIKGTLIPNAVEFQLLASITDISELKQAELNALHERDIANLANNAKSDFLSRMSHELRTPLNAILGFGELLKTDDKLDEDEQDNVVQIIEGGMHLLDLVNELLDLAKIDSGKMDFNLEEVLVKTLIESAISFMMPVADKNQITITIQPHEDVYIVADALRLRQVLMNLLSNAVKYNRTGGIVEVNCKLTLDNHLRINIKDTGVGIKQENHSQVFETFFRSSDTKGIEGTGIGLAITKKLIEAMQGRIGFNSEYQKGSNFWLELPLA